MKKRIEWIDMAKGYGIILVVMGHCFNKGSIIHNWIFSFHMPLFFILSGYCFCIDKYDSIAKVISRKFRTLIIPYIKFCFLGCIVSVIIPEWRSEFSLKQIGIDLYCAYPTLTHITSTWYLVALFILSVLFYFVVSFSKKYKMKWFPYLFVGLSGFMGFIITIIRKLFFSGPSTNGYPKSFSLPGGRLPFTLDTCMTALVFFAIGCWMRGVKEKRGVAHRNNKMFCLLFLVINMWVSLGLNSRVNLHGCTYGNIFYFYIAAISGALAVFFGVKEINRHQVLKRVLMFYGKNSLLFLGLQSLLIHLYLYFLNHLADTQYILYENMPWKHGWYAFVLIAFVFLPLLGYMKNYIIDRGEKIRYE